MSKKNKRSRNPYRFFNREEKLQIVKAIQKAEKATSGEIRVHLERKSLGTVIERTKVIFERIGMTKTALRNGVLIYIATVDHKFAILGDKGINEVVAEDFWTNVVSDLASHFKKNNFCEGICITIENIGVRLKAYFPHQTDDKNELPDDISIQDN